MKDDYTLRCLNVKDKSFELEINSLCTYGANPLTGKKDIDGNVILYSIN